MPPRKKTTKKTTTKKTTPKKRAPRKKAPKKAVKKTPKKNLLEAGSLKDLFEQEILKTEEPKGSLDQLISNMSKASRNTLEGRNLQHIASVLKKKQKEIISPTGKSKELDDSFWSELADRVSGNTLTLEGNVKISDVLGDEVFASLEQQISDAHLDKMRAERRIRMLNKLMDSAYELIDTKLSPILVSSTNA
jgi:hypothetical protein